MTHWYRDTSMHNDKTINKTNGKIVKIVACYENIGTDINRRYIEVELKYKWRSRNGPTVVRHFVESIPRRQYNMSTMKNSL